MINPIAIWVSAACRGSAARSGRSRTRRSGCRGHPATAAWAPGRSISPSGGLACRGGFDRRRHLHCRHRQADFVAPAPRPRAIPIAFTAVVAASIAAASAPAVTRTKPCATPLPIWDIPAHRSPAQQDNARLWRGCLANPRPGSRMIREGATPARIVAGTRRQSGFDLADHVAIAREFHVIGGAAPHVHQNDGAFAGGGERRHGEVGKERAHVIEDRSTLVKRHARDGGPSACRSKLAAKALPQALEPLARSLDFDVPLSEPRRATCGAGWILHRYRLSRRPPLPYQARARRRGPDRNIARHR